MGAGGGGGCGRSRRCESAHDTALRLQALTAPVAIPQPPPGNPWFNTTAASIDGSSSSKAGGGALPPWAIAMIAVASLALAVALATAAWAAARSRRPPPPLGSLAGFSDDGRLGSGSGGSAPPGALHAQPGSPDGKARAGSGSRRAARHRGVDSDSALAADSLEAGLLPPLGAGSMTASARARRSIVSRFGVGGWVDACMGCRAVELAGGSWWQTVAVF